MKIFFPKAAQTNKKCKNRSPHENLHRSPQSILTNDSGADARAKTDTHTHARTHERERERERESFEEMRKSTTTVDDGNRVAFERQ